MKADDVLSTLMDAATAVRAELGITALWYLFGSMLSDPDAAADIDLLVVYENASDGAQLRDWLRQLCLRLPVHLLLMSREEEAETGFVKSEGCWRLFPSPT